MRAIVFPLNGETMNMCAVAGLTSAGARSTPRSSRCRARASRRGFSASCAPRASAAYSRVREIQSWMNRATSGAMIEMTSRAMRVPAVAASAASAEDQAPSGHGREERNRPGDRGGDGRDEDVAVLHVRQFVADHAGKLVLREQFQDAGRDGHGGVLRDCARWRRRSGSGCRSRRPSASAGSRARPASARWRAGAGPARR